MIVNMHRTVCIVACIAAVPNQSLAEPIQPDRPGLATGTYTVNPGQMIIESGIQTDFRRDGARQSAWSIPQLTLRGGITDALEWDIIWNGAALTDANGEPSDWSLTDVAIGGKYSLYEGDSINITALGLVSLPVGTDPSTSDAFDPLLGLLWDASLSDQISLFGAIQASTFETDDGRAHDVQVALGATFSHSDSLATFIEYFAAKPYADEPSTEIVDAGVTYLLNEDIQLDFSAGVALNNATDHFIGAGIAWQF